MVNSDQGPLWIGGYIINDGIKHWEVGYGPARGSLTQLGTVTTVVSTATDKVLVKLSVVRARDTADLELFSLKFTVTLWVNGTLVDEICFTASSYCPANLMYCVPAFITTSDSDNGNYMECNSMIIDSSPLIEALK